jgi:hypothetical protein
MTPEQLTDPFELADAQEEFEEVDAPPVVTAAIRLDHRENRVRALGPRII